MYWKIKVYFSLALYNIVCSIVSYEIKVNKINIMMWVFLTRNVNVLVLDGHSVDSELLGYEVDGIQPVFHFIDLCVLGHSTRRCHCGCQVERRNSWKEQNLNQLSLQQPDLYFWSNQLTNVLKVDNAVEKTQAWCIKKSEQCINLLTARCFSVYSCFKS